MIKKATLLYVFSLVTQFAFAFLPPLDTPRAPANVQAEFRSDCALARASVEQDINNVRARLLVGGDIWWDGSGQGRYIVPKVTVGEEVSSIFAASVWIGGFDPNGNLKMAAKTYGTSSGDTDFWPGPLDPNTGTTEASECQKWDRFFEVNGDNIRQHIVNYNTAVANGEIEISAADISEDILGWPGRGNPFFNQINGFELPNTDQGLASFNDRNGNELYEPHLGDYPTVEIRDCPNTNFADQMFFWIYNDAGNVHTETQGNAIQMEVQVQSFAYATNDELNNMTFQRYKLINRAITDIDSCFFGVWMDPDLGCPEDDYIGADTSRSLAFVYNQDATDGQPGCDCPVGTQNVPTYCNEVPMLGVDYFRGPLDENGNELGMSSFTYFNRPGTGINTNTTDPQTAQEYYNYLSGSWKNGAAITRGGNGFGGTERINFVFPASPDDESDDAWSMCTAGLPQSDRRTIQASGPFLLKPGAVNELIVGVVWVPNIDYPCPNLDDLTRADDLAQAVFNNCFKIADGPDAPDLTMVELDQKVVVTISNDAQSSNNAGETYQEEDFQASEFVPEDEKQYDFEGYKIYQLIDPNVSVTELDDPSKAALIFQTDIQNGIGELINWEEIANPSSAGASTIFQPVLQVEGRDAGLKHTFVFDEDRFADEGGSLINFKDYYIMALAYGHNNYGDFNPQTGEGQARPYIEGRRNIRVYTVTPYPNGDLILNSDVNDGPVVTRLDGSGTGGVFLNMDSTQYETILSNDFDGRIRYLGGQAPVEVKIYNPRLIPDAKFFIRLVENGNSFDQGAYWQLLDENQTVLIERSDADLDKFNDQLIGEFGFSISVKQAEEPGTNGLIGNGATGMSLSYADASGPQWFDAIKDDDSRSAQFTNFLKTSPNEPDNALDPNQDFSNLGGLGYFVPYSMTDYRSTEEFYLSPGWMSSISSIFRNANRVDRLNNVDIVFTSDKSKWSQCIVIETATEAYYGIEGTGFQTIDGRTQFQVRKSASVTKEDNDGDGLPDIDPDRNVRGYAWFPGYAIDVETGRRLNIFFGENSVFRCDHGNINLCEDGENYFQGFEPGGDDMMFRLNDQLNIETGFNSRMNEYFSGQHMIYVTDMDYDGCESLHMTEDQLASCSNDYDNCEGRLSQLGNFSPTTRGLTANNIKWTSLAVAAENQQFLSYADGLIPNDLTIKLRVNNPFRKENITGINDGSPFYELDFTGLAAKTISTETEKNTALDQVNVVPNPYYGFSDYETSKVTTTIKITNLPAQCDVTIYSLDGKFIRKYTVNNTTPQNNNISNAGVPIDQAIPSLEWDLKNSQGVPIASGVYLIHVQSPDFGERVLKWFGVNRKFDPTGL